MQGSDVEKGKRRGFDWLNFEMTHCEILQTSNPYLLT